MSLAKLKPHYLVPCLLIALFASGRDFASAQAIATDADPAFKKLDINDDGVLSGSEAATVKAFDSDGDGEVTRAEYDAGMRKTKPVTDNEAFEKAQADLAALVRQRADALFKSLDGNADGWLSGTEIRQEHAPFDVDMNRRITKEEFEAGMLKSLGFTPEGKIPDGPAQPADGKGVRTKIENLGISFETSGKPNFMKDGIVSGYAYTGDEEKTVYTVTWFALDKRFDDNPQQAFKESQATMIGDGTKDPREEKEDLGPYPGVAVLFTQKDGSVVWMRQLIVKKNLVQALAIAKTEQLVDRGAFEKFLLSFKIDDAAPVYIPPPATPEKPRIELVPPAEPPKASSKVSHEAFVAALAKGDSKAMYAMMDPKLKELVDRPIFEQFVAIAGEIMGAVEDTGLQRYSPTLSRDEGSVVVKGKSAMTYAVGPVNVSTTVVDGKLLGFEIQSPEIEAKMPQMMLERIEKLPDDESEKFATYYMPAAAKFMNTLFDEGGEKALATLDPRVSRDLKKKGEVAVLDAIRKSYGKVTNIELEGFSPGGPDDEGLKTLTIVTAVTRAERGETKVQIIFGVEGMRALIIGYSFADDAPTASIPKRATVTPLVPAAPAAPSAK